MSANLLSIVLLISPAPLPSSASPPALVEPQSNAWAVVHAGQLWVCWTPGPNCFERVVFDDDERSREDPIDEDRAELEFLADAAQDRGQGSTGAEPWQLGYGGARSLWVELGERRWRVIRGQRRARIVEDPAPIRLRRIGPASCGPAAVVPTVIGGRLGWREAPRCAEIRSTSALPEIRACMAPGGPRLGRRRPTAVRLRAGLELASARHWTAVQDPERELAVASRRYASDQSVSFVVELGFDWHRRTTDRRAWASLDRRSQPQRRALPEVTPGPLAAAELEALTDVLCPTRQP